MRNTLLIPLMLLLSVTVKADLNKMSDSGETIAPDSEVWSCVLDDKTSLIWEVKSEKKGVQYALNTYTWFDGESGRDMVHSVKTVTGERTVIRNHSSKI